MHKSTAHQLTRASVAILMIALMIPSTVFGVADVLEVHRPLRDFDLRLAAAPSAEAESIVSSLGASVSWNAFGTPKALSKPGGFLSTGYTGAPAVAARQWISDHRGLFGFSVATVDELSIRRESELPGSGAYMVEFRQSAGALRLGRDGSVKVGIVDGNIFWVASSAVGDLGAVNAPSISASDAWMAAAANIDLAIDPADLAAAGTEGDWNLISVAGLSHPQRSRAVAFAIPGGGAIPAYETIVLDVTGGRAIAYTSFVDGSTGEVMLRQNRTQRAVDNPEWSFFAANPPLDHSTVDTRVLACWLDPLGDCDLELNNLAARVPWDQLPAGAPTFTMTGNQAQSQEAWLSPLTPDPTPYRPTSPLREYSYPWTNQWFTSKCDPSTLTHTGGALPDNDIDAAISNLFAMHNRIHDWSYFLGFTEVNGNAQVDNFGLTSPAQAGDPEVGNAQAGGIDGAYPAYQGRDNANQITLNDGIPPITNMYLWQSIAGAAYPPCVDGDYDAAVIAHEYGHMIQNRMVDLDNGLSGDHGRAMGESWSDLTAIEYLNGYGYVPIADESPYALGAYITGKKVSGIRNYGMNVSPLNYSNMDYDPVGGFAASPHANGEIWSATNFDIREALMAKYDASFPSSDSVLQARCADGEIPADLCPGNRRWSQIMHDAFLLMPSEPTFVDARDAYFAADLARSASPLINWPSNQTELADAFARRGLGVGAAASGTGDTEPTPSFESASGANATITFELVGADEGDAPVSGEVYIGEFESLTTATADTRSETPLGSTISIAEGTYSITARADGYGHARVAESFSAGESRVFKIRMSSNWASAARGSTASGDGADFDELIDDTEETNWENVVTTGDIQGSTVTVELGGGVQQVSRVQVSPMLEEGQNRFRALRQFAIETCDDTVSDCSLDSNYARIFTSAADAFPASGFRPLVPDWMMRSFDVPATDATHVRLVVLHNHCTGNPEYQDPFAADNDLTNPTDCRVDDPVLARRDRHVYVSELQVFSTQTPCLELPAAVVVQPVPNALEILTGDGDVFVDNCEDANLSFRVANHGGVDLTNIQILDIRPTSHAGTTVNTPLPFAVSNLPTGCSGTSATSAAAFNFTAGGLSHGDTLVFEVDLTADQVPGVQTGILRIEQTESDFDKQDVTFSFETDAEGWEVVRGTYNQVAGVGAATSTGYMESSIAADDACDVIVSPTVRLSDTSTLTLFNQFSIEPGDEILLGFYDRANVGLYDASVDQRSVITPSGGLRGYNVPAGAANGACASGEAGWSGPGPGWLDAQWSSADLGVSGVGALGKEFQISIKNATDPTAALTGLWFDEVTITDVLVAIPDSNVDVCPVGGNRRPDAVDDSSTTPVNTTVTIDVVANDSDPDGDPISVASVQSPTAQNGTTVNNGNGTVDYTPPAGFNGTDTFTYQICDDGGLCDSATVGVVVGTGGNGGGGGGGGDDSDSDSDDFDSDGKRDDEDSDDDNDGDSDNSDSDDDNDGIPDDADSDRDNDGISDEFDSQSTHESQKKKSKSSSAGASESELIEAGPNALLLIALAEGPGAENLQVGIYDPTGRLVATSVSAAGRSLATAVPLVSGAYSVEVKNLGGAPVNYELTLIESSTP